MLANSESILGLRLALVHNSPYFVRSFQRINNLQARFSPQEIIFPNILSNNEKDFNTIWQICLMVYNFLLSGTIFK